MARRRRSGPCLVLWRLPDKDRRSRAPGRKKTHPQEHRRSAPVSSPWFDNCYSEMVGVRAQHHRALFSLWTAAFLFLVSYSQICSLACLSGSCWENRRESNKHGCSAHRSAPDDNPNSPKSDCKEHGTRYAFFQPENSAAQSTAVPHLPVQSTVATTAVVAHEYSIQRRSHDPPGADSTNSRHLNLGCLRI